MLKKYRRYIGTILAVKVILLAGYFFITFVTKVEAQVSNASVGLYPPSTYLTNITWGNKIKAPNSCGDNVPGTWLANGTLYTATGDCQMSFRSIIVSGNLSAPNATIINSKYTLNGQLINKTGCPGTGCGAAGEKASGALALNGKVYIILRNWHGAGTTSHGAGGQMQVSSDGAQTFVDTGVHFDFGYPTFVNYGQNFSGGGQFVYVWGHAGDASAYNGSDHMIMMRVPTDQIENKNAYQYYAGNGSWVTSDPGNTSVITSAASVFDCGNISHTGNKSKCDRNGLTFNAPLGRYIAWISDWNGTDDFRNAGKGGFGVYESATPWDKESWKTVWHTPTTTQGWDKGGIGDSGNFVTKDMSADGKQMYLLCGCENNVTFYQATFSLAGNPPPTPITTPVVQTATPTPTRTATAVPTNSNSPIPTNGFPPIDYNDDDLGLTPTNSPTQNPTQNPSVNPSSFPTVIPSNPPTVKPTSQPSQPPVSGEITILGLSSGQSVSGTINVEARVSGTAEHIDFILDGNKYNSEYVAPYNFGTFINNKYLGFNSSNLSNGTHTLRVEAYTTGGLKQVTIQFTKGSGGSISPSSSPNTDSGDSNILIQGINSGQTVNGIIFVQAKASYSNISHVDFYIDNSLVNKEYIAPYDMGSFVNNKPIGFDTNKLSRGTHTLIVKVVLNGGQIFQRGVGFNR